jgi:putative MATE family efflux protein
VKDLTQGSIGRQLVALAVPIAVGMVLQTLYFLVDLYFVSGLGDAAIAGVTSAGTATFLVLAATQVLGVGTVALVSHAAGRKDQPEANLIFNQSVVLSAICGAITLLGGYLLTGSLIRSVAADEASAAAGISYLHAYTPGLALQFALVAMGSALRGTGIVKPTMLVQMVTVLLNTLLAPVLIAGWGTGHPLGTAGAGLASTISVGVGVVFLWIYFIRLEHYVALDPKLWTPRPDCLRRLLGIGLPAGAEFFLMFVIIGVVYWVIRGFGAEAQAGFGIGARVMQALFVPVISVAFAAAPLAGQNFGAGKHARVKETFWVTATWVSLFMVILTLFCQWRPDLLMRPFTNDARVIGYGAPYLHIISWNFVASGLIFTCSSLFQGLGNTWPSLLSSASRLVTYVTPAVLMSLHAHFELEHLWYLSVATTTLQAVTSLVLLRGQFRSRLDQAPSRSTVTLTET